MSSDVVSQVDLLYSVSLYDRNIVCVWGGINDLAQGANATTVYNNIVAYCQARQTVGWEVVVLTLLPYNNDSGIDTSRLAINANIMSNWHTFADAVADVGSANHLGQLADTLNGTYYQSDHIHPTGTGREIIANLVATAITNLL